MNKFSILLMAVITILSVSVFAQDAKKMNDTKQATEKTVYTCPMHSDVTSDKPGKCPKCGMALKPVVKTTASFACPMHPEVTGDKPGTCSKCGMALKPVVKAEMATYVCPMHADVTSDKPGKCSKCGMALKKKA